MPFGCAGRDHHAIGGHRHAALQALGGDRLARRQDADRRRVAVVAVAHRALDRLDHVRRRPEAERDRIADIEVADLPPGRLDLPGLGDDVPDGVHEAADAAATGMAAAVREGIDGFYPTTRSCDSFESELRVCAVDRVDPCRNATRQS